MTPNHRKTDLKAKVAIKGQKAADEIATEYGVHPTQIAQGIDDLR